MDNKTQRLTLTINESVEAPIQVIDTTKKAETKELNWYQDIPTVNLKIMSKQGKTHDQIMESNTMEEMKLEW